MRRTATIAGIVSSVLAACGGATAGTNGAADGGTTTDSGTSDGGSEDVLKGLPIPCEPKGLAALEAAPPVDYLERRREGRAVDGGPPDIRVDEKTGTPCKSAKDPAACETKLAQLSSPYPGGCSVPNPCDHEYLAYTRGDEVGLIEYSDALKFFAPITTIGEARELGLGGLCGGEQRYVETSSGYEISFIETECDGSTRLKRFAVSRDGTKTLLEDRQLTPPKIEFCPQPIARRAAGAHYDVAPVTDCGTWLAAAAHLEAASVLSFERLARELTSHGAPASLVRRARSAAHDETRHGRAMSRLARHHGARPRRVRPLPQAARPLLEIALENATEGGVRETFGAVMAAFQARAAQDDAVRSTLGTIALDEARHSELAADVATWLASRLTPSERRLVAEAAAATANAIAREVESEEPRERRETLGLPTVVQARALLAATRAQLFVC